MEEMNTENANAEDEAEAEAEVFDVSALTNGQAEGEWYGVPGSKVEIRIQAMKPRVLRNFRKKWTKTRMRGSKAIEILNDEAFHDDILDELVVEWKNIGKEGDDFPCTRENKIWLDGEWQAFSTLWQAVFAQCARVDEAVLEAELKN